MKHQNFASFLTDTPSHEINNTLLVNADCFNWLEQIPSESIHAVVTDPPYGVKEYELEQLQKKANGSGGTWRIPPDFDGSKRAPLPRFTALSTREIEILRDFFSHWSELILRVLKPGGHLFIASNAYLSQIVFSAVAASGIEFRGEVIRLVRTMRGGDRPKNAEAEYDGVCTLPRGCYEPWGLFRKPMPPKMTVKDCLDKFQTGGLRRMTDGKPFNDVIESTRTPKKEKEIANHPSLKPQSFLRQIVYASLPLGEGLVLDPFMGSGSTIAAAASHGYSAIGVERHQEYYQLSIDAIPKLRDLPITLPGITQLTLPLE